MVQASASRVRCDIDFDRPGRQVGYVRASLSRNTAGWGTVEIPFTVVQSGARPTVLFTGGVHGDEYEGQIAVSRLALDLDPAAIQGRVLLMPMVNVPAALADTRLSPVDGWDINRCFPGDPRGTFSSMLAHFMASVILPLVDVSVDLHKAGHSNDSALSTNMHRIADPALMRRTLDAAAAFGAPFNVVFGGVDEGGTFTSSVERRGILSLGTELGGWGRVSVEGVRIGRRGLLNTLKHFGLMEGAPDTAQRDGSPATRHMMVPDPSCYTTAPADGLFEPRHHVGDAVEEGEVAGSMHSVQDVDRAPQELRFGHRGIVWLSPGPAVGESGCGKSTLGRLLLRLIEPSAGTIRFGGEDLSRLGRAALRRRRRDMQIIFQDPFGSLNPRMTVAAAIGEAYAIHGIGDRAARRRMVGDMLDLISLPHAAADRYPHEFSGGQRQRIGIARALALRPRFIVCDEAVSALDVSVQAQIVNLLQDLQRELRLTYLFISHNLAVVRHISARVAVMYLGRIVELAETDALLAGPAHPYTRALLSAIPPSHPDAPRHRQPLPGDVSSPIEALEDCRFAPRCPFVEARCRAVDPPLAPLTDRLVACHRALDGTLPQPERTPCRAS